MISTMCGRLAILVAALVASSLACDKCEPGHTRCQGDVQGVCMTTGGTFDGAGWLDKRCPIACREGQCVDSAEPLPACANLTNSAHNVCFNGALAHCLGDYPILLPPCDRDTHCVMAGSCGALCLLEDDVDPRCAASLNERFCDSGRVATLCACDRVGSRQDCGGPDLCQDVPSAVFCTLSPTADPRCGEPSPNNVGFCADGHAHHCRWGFVVESEDCGAGVCVENTGRGFPVCSASPALAY